MNIGNKHYRDKQRKINNFKQEEKKSDEETKLAFDTLEKRTDDSVISIADGIGTIIGHVLFRSR